MKTTLKGSLVVAVFLSLVLCSTAGAEVVTVNNQTTPSNTHIDLHVGDVLMVDLREDFGDRGLPRWEVVSKPAAFGGHATGTFSGLDANQSGIPARHENERWRRFAMTAERQQSCQLLRFALIDFSWPDLFIRAVLSDNKPAFAPLAQYALNVCVRDRNQPRL
jgi:hypothetical protein